MTRTKVSEWAIALLFLASTLAVVVAAQTTPSGITAVSASAIDMPSARSHHDLTYDSESDLIVMFGGPSADTWVFDTRNSSWHNMVPSLQPPRRYCPEMAYNSKADKVVLFGGTDEAITTHVNDTWTYDLNKNTWTKMMPLTSPSARRGMGLVYDSLHDRMILFGGISGDTESGLVFHNDTWTYDLNSNTWTPVLTANAPQGLVFAAIVYDDESDRVVLFGGMGGLWGMALSETWVFDPANETWSNMAPAEGPSERYGCPATYDVKADEMLVFGGGPDNGRDNTWAYDLDSNTWSRLNITSIEPSDRLTSMAYDVNSDRTVMFGGLWPATTNGDENQETWVFDRGNRTWTMVLPDIVSPSLAITSPSDGASLASKEVNVTGTASDNIGVARVEVGLDNVNWILATGTTTWQVTISLADGKNTVYVRATDTSGNTITKTLELTVPSQDIPIWVWIVAAAAVACAALAAYATIRKRKRTS